MYTMNTVESKEEDSQSSSDKNHSPSSKSLKSLKEPIASVDDDEEEESLPCTQGILLKRGRFGIFRKPWVERMFVLDDNEQTLFIIGGKKTMNIDLQGASCRELPPSMMEGKPNVFEIKFSHLALNF